MTRWLRTVGGAVAVGVGASALGVWLVTAVVSLAARLRGSAPAAPDEVLTLLAAMGGLAVLVWLALGLLLAVLGHLPGRAGAITRHWAEQVTPAAVRRMAAVLVGATLGGALAPGTATADGTAPSPALAATSPQAPSPVFAPSTSANPPAPGWTPDRPVVRRQTSPRLVATAPPADERPGIVVRRGDTLWDLVRHHLGSGASDAEVAAAWPRWHEANRAVIGPDPDVLLPGQVLQAPVEAEVLR